jgi:hypothetical protein
LVSFGSPLKPLPLGGHYNYDTPIYLEEWGHHHLTLDEKFTIAINELLKIRGLPVKGADLAVTIDYAIPLLRLHRRKAFRIVARPQSDGNMHWYSEPFA